MSALIDSNIIIYAHNRDSIFFGHAKKFIEDRLLKEKVYMASQNLLEAYSIFTKILKLQEDLALEIVNYYFQQPSVLMIYPTEKTTQILFELLKRYQIKGERVYDLNLVALMIENNIKTIYTKNVKDFAGIKEIKAVNPL